MCIKSDYQIQGNKLNIFITQAEPGSRAFGIELLAAHKNGFEYGRYEDTNQVFAINEEDDLICTRPLCPAETLHVLEDNYPDGIPDSALSDEVLLFLAAEGTPVEPELVDQCVNAWQSYINFNTASSDQESAFYEQAHLAWGLDFTHIISADGRYYQIVNSDGDVLNLTDAEMGSLGLPLPKPPITEADALADLAGEPRPDNPSANAVEPEEKRTGGTSTPLSSDQLAARIVMQARHIILNTLEQSEQITPQQTDTCLKLATLARL